MITATLKPGARLCNQLFEYAIARSVAEKNGYKWHINPKEWLGHGLFDCDLGVIDGKIERTLEELGGQKFNPEVFNVPDFTCLSGYWQSEKYFDRDKVKEWFKPIETAIYDDFSWEFPNHAWCYINVRGTDQHIPHLTLPKEYYEQAMAIMEEFNPFLQFLVITDDVDLAKDYFPDLPVFSNDRNTDFCLLNSATFMIGAISTFAWWAGYLNDFNVVVMPKHFYHHKLPHMGWGPIDIHTHKFIWI